MAAMRQEKPASQPGSISWKQDLELVLVLLSLLMIPVLLVVFAGLAVQAARYSQEEPARYSVELVGAKGIGPALDPGAESPAFNLLVHVYNGHIYETRNDAGSEFVVSYAGVPLARGRAPAWCVETKKAATVEVDATSGGGVGIPEGLFELMAEDRRLGVAQQLDVDFRLDYGGLFTCRVEMDGVQRASKCEQQNLICSI